MLSLQTAIEKPDPEAVKINLAAGIDVNSLLPCKQFPLVFAINRYLNADEKSFDEKKCIAVVEMLLISGANANIRYIDASNFEKRPISLLEKICSYSSKSDLSFFDSDFIFIPKLPTIKKTPENERFLVAIAELIIKHGGCINADESKTDAPIILALGHGLFKMVELLLRYNANIHVHDQDGNTPLHYACAAGNKSFVIDFIKRGLNIHDVNQLGAKPLDACETHLQLALMLLKYPGTNFRLDYIDFLTLAEKENDSSLTDFLFENGVARVRRKDGSNALHYIKSIPIAKRLLAAGTDIESTNSYGLTPVFTAFQFGNIDLACYLIEQNAKIEMCDTNNETVLHHLAQKNALTTEMYQALKAQKIDLNIKNREGQTALHIACQFFNVDMIIFLLAQGCDTDLINDAGLFALEVLGMYFYVSDIDEYKKTQDQTTKIETIFSKLLASFPPSKTPENHKKLLLIAQICQLHNFTAIILNSIDFKKLSQKEISELIQEAVSNQNLQLLQWLIKNNASLNIENIFSSPIGSLNKNMIKFLLANGAKLDLTQTLKNTFVRLIHRCRNIKDETFHLKAIEIFDLLIAACPRNIFSDSFTQYLLSQAILEISSLYQEKPNFTIWHFIQHLITPRLPSLEQQGVLVNAALLHGDKKTLSRLISENNDTCNQINKIIFFKKVVDYAALDWLQFLITHRFNSAKIVINDFNGKISPLEYLFLQACECRIEKKRQQLEFMAIELIKNGAPIHFPSKIIFSVFHTAIELNWLNIVKLLLEENTGYSIDMPVISHSSATTRFPLELAVEQGHAEMVYFLISKKADPNIVINTQDSLLHLACRKGYLAVAELLIRAGANIHFKRKMNSIFYLTEVTPMVDVLESKHSADLTNALTTLLLEKGAIVDTFIIFCSIHNKLISKENLQKIIANSSCDEMASIRALHHAVLKKNILFIKVFLDQHKTAFINVRDESGRTPLHIVTQHIDEDAKIIYNLLIAAGADPTFVDFSNFSIKEYSLFYNTFTVFGIETPANISIENFQQLCTFIANQPEFKMEDNHENQVVKFNISHYSYKLIKLFGNFDSAKNYLLTHHTEDSLQPIHDLCLFNLPVDTHWHNSAWAQLAFKHGNEVTKYLHLAPRIEKLLGECAPANLEEMIAIAKNVKYSREIENPPLAKLFSNHQITEDAFNRVLAIKSRKKSDRLPPLFVEGSELKSETSYKKIARYRLIKLPCDDDRGFILGELTHCCQSVGSAGENYAMHGMTSEYGGFYVLIKTVDHKEIERLLNVLTIAKASKTYQGFLDKLKVKEQRKKYSQWKTNYLLKERNISDQELLTHLIDDLNLQLNESCSEEIAAQIWAWLSQSGKLVFDSWEHHHVQDDALCKPFLIAAAKQAVMKYHIPEVLLGQGGNTPTNLPFPITQTPEIPHDYLGHRDSRTQLVIFSSSPTLTPDIKSETPSFVATHLSNHGNIYNHYPFLQKKENLEKIIQFWIAQNIYRKIILLPTAEVETKPIPKIGYQRNAIDPNGEYIYGKFNISKQEAFQLLKTAVIKEKSVRQLLQLAVRESLATEKFLQYLKAKKITGVNFQKHLLQDTSLNPTHHAEELITITAFIDYNLDDGPNEKKLIHPAILHALAYLQKIELHLWCLAEDERLLPYRQKDAYDYSCHIPAQTDAPQRIDLLLIDNCFENLRFLGYANGIPVDPVYPCNSLRNSFSIKEKLIENFIYILLLHKKNEGKDTGWASLIFTPKDNDPIEKSTSTHTVTYLDASAAPLPPTISKYLPHINSQYPIHNKVVYHTEIQDTLIWVLEVLKTFINTGNLMTLPVANLSLTLATYNDILEKNTLPENASTTKQDKIPRGPGMPVFFQTPVAIADRLSPPKTLESLIEIDVPHDGTCLFYSIALSYLLPSLNDHEIFNIRFKKLFGAENLAPSAAEDLRNCLLNYDGNTDFITDHASTLEVLIDTRFRENVVAYMDRHKKDFSEIHYTEAEEKSFDAAMLRMKKPKTWAGHRELEAISQLIEQVIIVYEKNDGQTKERARYGAEKFHDNPIYLVRVANEKGVTTLNHYHYLIKPKYIFGLKYSSQLL